MADLGIKSEEKKLEGFVPELEDKRRTGAIFSICPRIHILFLVSVGLLILYYGIRENKSLMTAYTEGFLMNYHRIMSNFFSEFRLSVAEICYAIAVIFAVRQLFRAVVLIVKEGQKLKRVYITVLGLVSSALAIYAFICFFWGAYYYGRSFSEKSGIEAKPVAVEELAAVTEWFAEAVNENNELLSRTWEERKIRFGSSREEEVVYHITRENIYNNICEKYPFLTVKNYRNNAKAKPVLFSYIMSHMNFTGFFFPLTGEANVNIHSPYFLTPATIAHEFAHQAGVAKEDEANFVAVMAGMESEDPFVRYSCAMLAYIHLSNALYGADYDSWKETRDMLCEDARREMSENNEYWSQFESKVSTASEAVYTSFLQGQGQELGIRSYGACVDLLVAYYLEDALAARD